MALLSSSIRLPCNISTPTPDDQVLLLLFYRNETEQPLFTLDARDSVRLTDAPAYYGQNPANQSEPLPNSRSSIGRRVQFEFGWPIAHLHIASVRPEDAGVYRCRVDFRRSRTVNRLTELLVIGEIASSRPSLSISN